MDLLVTLGRTLGFSLAAGVNLYATVALLGLASRYGWVALPEQFQVFNHPWVIGLAGALYVVEFFADKIPWVDTMWDTVHTFVRPVGGALIAVATLGEASPTVEGLIALLGGAVAAGSHVTKAEHARGGQRQPGAVLELGAEPARGCLRRRPGLRDAQVPAGRAWRERADPC